MGDDFALTEQEVLDAAVAEGGAYEVLRRRLSEMGAHLRRSADDLNAARLEEFGRSVMDISARVRIRTENNCVARDIARVGNNLLFGYNVYLGLKKETRVEDVFSLYRLVQQEDGYEAEPIPLAETFLAEPAFVDDFTELYRYYKHARLLQLSEKNGRLLAAFQIGERITDRRVFRWSVSPDGKDIRYIDNRGERDISPPPAHDFTWTRTGRDDAVNGRHPHINILDTVFVETVGGDLTVKRENNTEDGLGIYREDVLDKTQSLDDAQIEYARTGSLILIKILPYRENEWRYLVYNTITHDVRRIDAIGQACIQLPEDHGIIFPGGYYLQNGEYKLFDLPMDGMHFRRMRRSPNGEDVLYVFYEPEAGRLALFKYNLIERKLDNPLVGNGYTLLEDGRMILFEDQSGEAGRVHPMQVWQTPFQSDEYAARNRTSGTVLGRIGNADLVRGISDLFSITKQIETQAVSSELYDKLCKDTRKLFDSYFWLKDEENFVFAPLLREIARTAELVLDEYDKVQSIRGQSERSLLEARTRQKDLIASLVPDSWERIQDFADALGRIRMQRGALIALRDMRYMDLETVDGLEGDLNDQEERISRATGEFLADERSLEPYLESLQELDAVLPEAKTAAELIEPAKALDGMAADLDMLSALMASLSFEDVTQQTRIIEGISTVYAQANQARSRLESRRKDMGAVEDVARFGAQFALFSQSIANSLALADTPERCDDELSRLLMQLEEIESQFAAREEFQADILAKREELLESFETRKQALSDERNRQAHALFVSAERSLSTFARRTARMSTVEEVNAFYTGDPMARRVRQTADRLRELKDTVRADDVEARLKASRDQAIRALRDKTELYDETGTSIRLGPRHTFSVNTQELDITILPQGQNLAIHLTGTDYREVLVAPELEALRSYWNMHLESESEEVCRAEYLAFSFLMAALNQSDGLSLETLRAAISIPGEVESLVRAFAAPRYRDGYEKGIHDHDAARIVQAVFPLADAAGLLIFSPESRALAMLFWKNRQEEDGPSVWPDRARASMDIRRLFGNAGSSDQLQREMRDAMRDFADEIAMRISADAVDAAADYLIRILAATTVEFPCSKYGTTLYDGLREQLEANHVWAEFTHTLQNLEGRLAERWNLTLDWVSGLTSLPDYAPFAAYAYEAAALVLMEGRADMNMLRSEVDLNVTVDALLANNPRIRDKRLALRLDEFYGRLRRHMRHTVPGFRRYQEARRSVLEGKRDELRLEEFKPRPLTSFVRNRLIDKVYLPIIGDNLAKQIGTVGEAKRTDLMGMLLLISPPGYGKTTLMEYVAHCLGLIFMKINGPALGHSVISLDPGQAPDATSRQELEKLNLALEMGNNVMLYIDDIQHTNPEFLQKFISLCDGTRRIEGVWKGKTRTYDMRGKKFCVVMAGNPYTESGDLFTIPDMLANRADVYNLGEVLGGMEKEFADSYIENCLTSNQVLAPLAQRGMDDFYRFLDRAGGATVSANDFSHPYSEAESAEITAILKRLLNLRDVVLQVNRHYILSASQSDKYRTEPPFKLQGSYRNMNKLAEQVAAVMNEAETERLLDDLYLGEAQLLTGSAEENLLKLAEIRGTLSPDQKERWEEIKREFVRNKAFGGDKAEVGDRVVAQLSDLVASVRSLGGKG